VTCDSVAGLQEGVQEIQGSISQVTGNEICKIHIYIYIAMKLDRGSMKHHSPRGRREKPADRKAGWNDTDFIMGWTREVELQAQAQLLCCKELMQTTCGLRRSSFVLIV